MPARGTATLNFGSAPGSGVASVAVTGQTGIGLSDGADAFMMAESTADHNAEEHKLLSRLVGLTCGDIVAGTGFTIYAETDLRLTGTVKVQWVWSA